MEANAKDAELRASIKEFIDKLLIKEHQRAYSHAMSIFVVTALKTAEENLAVDDLLSAIESYKKDSPEEYHSAIESLLCIVRSLSKKKKGEADPQA